jgi:flavorubredoxin
MAYVATLVNSLAPKTRYAALIGSYGWGTTMPDIFMEMLREFRATFFEPVLAKGTPKADTFQALDDLAEAIVQANFSGAHTAGR